jgi:hypothetical protein
MLPKRILYHYPPDIPRSLRKWSQCNGFHVQANISSSPNFLPKYLIEIPPCNDLPSFSLRQFPLMKFIMGFPVPPS